MNYEQILTKSARIVWQNKFLWLLGFLAGLGTISNSFRSQSNYNEQYDGRVPDIDAMVGMMLLVLCVGLVIFIGMWVLGIISKAGLIAAVADIEAGEQPDFRSSFAAGKAKFLPLLGLNVLFALPPILLGLFFIASFAFLLVSSGVTVATLAEDPAAFEQFAIGAGIIAVFVICGLICVTAVISFLLQFINAFAYRAIVLNNLGVLESISYSWELIRKNLTEMFLLSLLFGVFGLIIGALIQVVVLPIFIMLGVFSAMGDANNTVFLASFGILMLIIMVMTVLVTSPFTAWRSTAFTLAYLHWDAPNKEVEAWQKNLTPDDAWTDPQADEGFSN